MRNLLLPTRILQNGDYLLTSLWTYQKCHRRANWGPSEGFAQFTNSQAIFLVITNSRTTEELLAGYELDLSIHEPLIHEQIFQISQIHEQIFQISRFHEKFFKFHKFTNKFFKFYKFTNDIFSFHESRTNSFSRIHEQFFSFSKIHERKKSNSRCHERFVHSRTTNHEFVEVNKFSNFTNSGTNFSNFTKNDIFSFSRIHEWKKSNSRHHERRWGGLVNSLP